MSDKPSKEASEKQLARRNIVRGITIAGSGISVTTWTKPIVESVILPAHAQTTTSVSLTGAANFNV